MRWVGSIGGICRENILYFPKVCLLLESIKHLCKMIEIRELSCNSQLFTWLEPWEKLRTNKIIGSVTECML
jgi:hypothetical protein